MSKRNGEKMPEEKELEEKAAVEEEEEEEETEKPADDQQQLLVEIDQKNQSFYEYNDEIDFTPSECTDPCSCLYRITCSQLEASYTIISLVFCMCTLVFLFLTSCTDPGMLLRQQRPISAEEQYAPGNSKRMRYCDECNINVDRKTEHCDDCGVCIENYDHHCPWMGKCIGKKNMRWFVLFNLCWVSYMVFVIVISLNNIGGSLQHAVERQYLRIHHNHTSVHHNATSHNP